MCPSRVHSRRTVTSTSDRLNPRECLVMDLNPTPIFSIEFYPPRTNADESKLNAVHQQLAKLRPDFFSVTYGAGGSTKQGTKQIVLRYQKFGYAYIDYTPVAEEGFLIVVSLRALITHRAPKANIILLQC